MLRATSVFGFFVQFLQELLARVLRKQKNFHVKAIFKSFPMIIYHKYSNLPRGFLCKKYLYAFLTILYLPIHSVDVYQNCRIWFDPVLGSRQGPASTAH